VACLSVGPTLPKYEVAPKTKDAVRSADSLLPKGGAAQADSHPHGLADRRWLEPSKAVASQGWFAVD